MKKLIVSFVCVFMLVLSSTTVSYAYDIILFNNNAANYKSGFISSPRSFLLTTDVEPTVCLLASPPDTDRYYLYSKTSEAVPVVYASRFTGFLQAQADRLVNAIGTGGAGGSGTFTVDLAPITTRLDLLIDKSSDTVVNVINNNTWAWCPL